MFRCYKRQGNALFKPRAKQRLPRLELHALVSYTKGKGVMINILRAPDDIKIECEADNADCTVETEIKDEKLYVYISAAVARPRFICLRWNYRVTEPTRIMGDKWERSYGDMEWHSLNGEIFMPWYFLANSGDKTVGCGVMTGAGSFVSFQCDASGCTAWFDVRCGGTGVRLNGRRLLAGVIVCREYSFRCGKSVLPRYVRKSPIARKARIRQ